MLFTQNVQLSGADMRRKFLPADPKAHDCARRKAQRARVAFKLDRGF